MSSVFQSGQLRKSNVSATVPFRSSNWRRWMFGSFTSAPGRCFRKNSSMSRPSGVTICRLRVARTRTTHEWGKCSRIFGDRRRNYIRHCWVISGPNDPTRAHLISMWTAPTHREQGIGRLLVKEVFTWAHRRNARTLLLMVTSNNEPAIRFYERLGFSRTGPTEPYPNDQAVLEYEMSCQIP
jgi:ribosomal protein S18 acetylase RimI-like enzyme